MNTDSELRVYYERKLLSASGLGKYFEQSSVVSVELDEKIIYDLLVLMPDEVFAGDFKREFGDCFVLNDQKNSPSLRRKKKSNTMKTKRN